MKSETAVGDLVLVKFNELEGALVREKTKPGVVKAVRSHKILVEYRDGAEEWIPRGEGRFQ